MNEETMEKLRLCVEKGLVDRQNLDEAASVEELVKKLENRIFSPEDNDWREPFKRAIRELLNLGLEGEDIKKMLL